MSNIETEVAKCYADAWRTDIKTHLDREVPSWDQMGPNQRAAMIRVASEVVRKLAEAGYKITTKAEWDAINAGKPASPPTVPPL